EQKLKDSESRLRIAALSSELGTWMYYPATKELLWDNSSRELFGVDNETPITLELFWDRMHPDDREQALNKMIRALYPA
ncbi:MAG: PAS domain-containing sensor histidine kinase, partial [Bacteroidota bacterium]